MLCYTYTYKYTYDSYILYIHIYTYCIHILYYLPTIDDANTIPKLIASVVMQLGAPIYIVYSVIIYKEFIV